MLQDIIMLYYERWDFFMQLLLEHIQISSIAIILAAIIGTALGLIIAEHPKLSVWVLGTTNIIYTIPSIALLGALIPFTGIGNTTAIIALTVYALLPMVRNTCTGIINIPPSIIETGIGMGSTKLQMLYRIKIPLALPVIMAGFRNMVVMTISLCGIASFIGAGGLGVAIYRGITTYNPTMTFAGSLLIAIIALGSDLVLGFIEKQFNVKINGKGSVNK